MKKTILFILVALFATSSLFADDISVQQALQIASQFAANEPTAQSKMRKAQAALPAPTLAYAVKSDVSDKDNVYVINYGNDMGFVVVSGETGTDAILGYCDHGAFEYEKTPMQLKGLLGYYTAAIDSLRQNPALAVRRKTAQNWSSHLGNVIVEPLLTTQWNQWAPYNNLCPTGCPSGCVPTAVAQIMRYWRWPDKTIGAIGGEDFSGHSYNWDQMIDNYETTLYTEEQGTAVAQLMADIGKALNTIYDPTGSGTSTDFLPLVYNFKYEPNFEAYSDNLNEVMKAELDESRPMLYSAGSILSGIGHELVVDGYTSNNYFHFNYGWGGRYDGFYKSTLINEFIVGPSVVTGIRPGDFDIKEIDGIKYVLYPNGIAHIIDYMSGGVGLSNGVLEIPAIVEDNGMVYKVTRICQRAFMRKGNFTKLIMGDNIETIDAFAFIYSYIDELVLSDKMEVIPDEAFQLTKVKKLTIGKNVKRIGKRAFYNCNLNEGVISKSPAFTVDEEAFAFTHPSKEYDWLACITSLGRKAFYGAQLDVRNWRQVDFPNLEVIGDSAFVLGNIGSSTRFFNIRSRVRMISPSAFDGWPSTSIISADDDSPYFSVDDQNNIYNKEKTSLIVSFRSIPSEEYPESLIKLAPGCFRPGRAWNMIPSTVIDMTDSYRDCTEIDEPFRCLAVVPPVIPDDFFEGKMDTEWATLLVPQGTEYAYLNAPGWRHFRPQWTRADGISKGVIGNQDYNSVPAQNREYHMVVDRDGEEQRVNIPVSEISSMEISDDGRNMIIRRNGKDAITTAIAAIDSIKWLPGFVYENAEIFNLNEDNLTAEAQQCTVKFDATVIDDDVQLCVRNLVLTPNVMEGVVSGFAVDLSLSDGRHELSGTAGITIPMTPAAGREVGAAYYNEESGEWEPVCFERDNTSGDITITTNHLSTYAIFEVAHVNTKDVILNVFKEAPVIYALNEASKKLFNIMSSPDPDFEMAWEFKNDMAFWQSAGLDVFFNAANGSLGAINGYKPFAEELENAVTAMGYLGTALSILDVARADLRGDDIGVAAGTLSSILNFATGQMASAIGTPIMSVSMAGVAAIGIALNKFGETVSKSKLDFYRLAYGIYYSKEGYYRSATDWYNYFYPAFEKGGMTENRLNAYIEQSVRNYCYKFWEDDDERAFCIAEAEDRAKSLGISTWSYETESLRQQISDEYYSELMNGILVSVFQAIRNHQKVEAYNRYVSAAKGVAALVNRQIELRIWDNSWKEGEKSKYEGWTVRFSYIPSSIGKKDDWQVTLNEHGRGSIGYFTEYALILNDMPTRLTLIDPDGKEVADYPFTIADKRGKQIVDIDLSTGGVELETPHLDGLELTYDSNVVEYPFGFGDLDGDGLLYLDNTLNKRARFQTAIEKFFYRHAFITVDKNGKFKIGDDIVGGFEGDALESSGKFTINVSHNYVEKTITQFIDQVAHPNKDLGFEYGLLNGIIQHSIPCEYKITRKSVDSNEFEVSYSGSGQYALLANVIAHVEGVDDFDLLDAAKSGKEGVKITPNQITTQEVNFDGEVTLKYTTKLTQQ